MIDKKTKPTPKKKKPSSEKVAHYTAVLVEDLESKFQFVIEHVTDVEERMMKRMDQRFAEQDARFDVIEHILLDHSEILKDHSEILKDHGEILKDHSEILKDHGEILKDHSQSFSSISGLLNQMIQRETDHSSDIKTLQDAVFGSTRSQ